MTNNVSMNDVASATQQATAYLIVRNGPMEGTLIPVQAGQNSTIGRSTSNRIVVADEVCSRNHCEVFYEDGRWKLREIGRAHV